MIEIIVHFVGYAQSGIYRGWYGAGLRYRLFSGRESAKHLSVGHCGLCHYCVWFDRKEILAVLQAGFGAYHVYPPFLPVISRGQSRDIIASR